VKFEFVPKVGCRRGYPGRKFFPRPELNISPTPIFPIINKPWKDLKSGLFIVGQRIAIIGKRERYPSSTCQEAPYFKEWKSESQNGFLDGQNVMRGKTVSYF
jgi:hypothetical protein